VMEEPSAPHTRSREKTCDQNLTQDAISRPGKPRYDLTNRVAESSDGDAEQRFLSLWFWWRRFSDLRLPPLLRLN
jgi:hypothetical protein